MKVLFLIRSLGSGGAERQLVAVSRGLAARGHDVVICMFYAGGALESQLEGSAVRLDPLGKGGRWDIATFARRLVRALSRERPDVIHAYLPTANCVAAVTRLAAPRARLLWGVRASNVELDRYDRLTRLSYRLEPRLAPLCDRIIANSYAGRAHCIASGYPASKLVVIPNGIDTELFHPSAARRAEVRAELGITDGETLVGLVARLDPMKDHPTFLRAAATVRCRRRNIRFVCIGDGPEGYRLELQHLATELGLAPAISWLGPRADMPGIYNALDVAVLASAYGEGMPNAIGEAMACGVPCVVTDVGDAARLVADTGVVVPPRDPHRLAGGIVQLLDAAGEAGPSRTPRARIVERFDLDRLVDSTNRLLCTLV